MIEPTLLEHRVRRFVAASVPSLYRERSAVLAASGGADSTAMISLLCESAVVEPRRCVVAHFDHRLRAAAAADDDRRAVQALCAGYGLELVAGSWGAPRRGEAAAREARYAFLAQTCRAAGLRLVAGGHTADDQIETVLMNVMRGAGIYGLAGMQAEGAVPVACADADERLALVRPLLDVRRSETRLYCQWRGLAFSDDASNEDERFLRNRVRRKLLRAIDRGWPGARETVLAASARARAAIRVMDEIAAAAVLEQGDDRVVLSRPVLRELARDGSVHAFRLALTRLLGDAREFARMHYATMQAAIDARTGATFRLPRAVEIVVDTDALVLSLGPPPAIALPAGLERRLPFAGSIGGWWIEVAPRHEACESSAQKDEAVALRLPKDAVLRACQPGDRIQPRGMRGHKKLQDYYVDRKVPRRERRSAPLIANGTDVAWTPFGPVALLPAANDGVEWTVRWHRVDGLDRQAAADRSPVGVLANGRSLDFDSPQKVGFV